MQASQTSSTSFIKPRQRQLLSRLLLPALLVFLILFEDTRTLTVNVLADAYWQVATYVAATLALMHTLSDRLDRNGQFQQKLSANATLQVVFASVMGALPGCGGAIVVITQFVRGQLGFGSVVAVLTATMGDAAFLLLAVRPMDGLAMVALGVIVGVVSGLIVNKIHTADFLRPQPPKARSAKGDNHDDPQCDALEVPAQGQFWRWLLAPSLVVAIAGSLQMDVDALFGLPADTLAWVGALAAMVAATFWAISRSNGSYQSAVSEAHKSAGSDLFQRVAQDTNFVLSWVIAAFLAFELSVHWFDLDLARAFGQVQALLPLVGVAIGLLPGCGPQILVTSFYINDMIPLSAQIGNAISNDGDALFPAIALAPRAALIATFYSTIPALVCAYGYYYFFE